MAVAANHHRPHPKGMAFLARILRYPVKGLSAQPLDAAALAPGHGLPGDRVYALAQASDQPPQSGWLPGDHLFTLARFPRLAQLQTAVEGNRLTIRRRGRVVLEADLITARGQAVIAAFFAAFLAGENFGHPRVVQWPEGFGDRPRPWLSLIGAGTLEELERTGGRRLDAEALRMNLLVADLPPRAEQGWIGQRVRIGDAELLVTEAIERAILPELLRSTFGHGRLGMWAEVVGGGEVRVGDWVSPMAPPRTSPDGDQKTKSPRP